MIGPLFDAMVYGRRLGKLRARAVEGWPEGARMIDTAVGPVRVRDTGGALPPLVIAVASPCVVRHYDDVVATLRDRYRVVVFDMPGFGFSPPQRHYNHSLREGGQAIAAVLEAMDLRAVTLVGASINGLYAFAASHFAGERLARLVLVQTPDAATMHAWFGRITQKAIRRRVFGQFLNFTSRQRFPPLWFRITLADQSRVKAFTEPALKAMDEGACYCFASFVQGMFETPVDDPLLSVDAELPVTLIWGAQDRTHRSSKPEAIRNHAPHAEIRRVEDAGHYPDLEAPDSFAAVLAEPVSEPEH